LVHVGVGIEAKFARVENVAWVKGVFDRLQNAHAGAE
jgi:hypothetical protein